MSDFGVSITITRADMKNLTADEVDTISEFLKEFGRINEFKDALEKPIKLDKIIKSEEMRMGNVLKGISLIISEYWANDIKEAFESEEKLLEFIFQDKELADDIIIAIKSQFGETYDYDLYYGFC